MLYFKNVELAATYHISEGTVRNWIKEAEQGKLNLKLHILQGRAYVANTSRNITLVEQLIAARKKYRNTKAAKVLVPRPDFYATYSQPQIYDIVTSIEKYHEIPRQYSYFADGATSWDAYIQRMEQENTPNNLTMTRKLLALNGSYIDELIAGYRKVNVIDVGVGNAMPVKDFLARLLHAQKLSRYIALDISTEMLQIAEANVRTWFGQNVHYEGFEFDITRGRFTNMLTKNYLKDTPTDTCNIILFLGGTLQNFRKRYMPLQVINDSMRVGDLLIHSQKLDSTTTRQQFDFTEPSEQPSLPLIHSFVIDQLNVDPSLYDIELGYDAKKRERYERVRFKVAVTINVKFEDSVHRIDVSKGETILVWRASQDTVLDIMKQFDKSDFHVLQSSQTPDRNFLLTISRTKCE